MKRFAFSTLLLFLLSGLSAQIRIATYQYADNDRIANIEPFAKHLKTVYGLDTRVKSYPTVHAFIDAIRNNEADVALINTFGYFLLQVADKPYPMRPLLTLAIREDAKDNYKTAFLSSTKSTITALEDVKKSAADTRLALVAKGSTSGNMLPRLALSYAGIKDAEQSFAKVMYAGTHARAIDAVLNNEADLATMGLTEYQRYLERDSANASKLRLVWVSPEIPLGPVLFNNKLSKQDIETLSRAFLELNEKDPESLNAIKAGWSEAKQATKYITITDSFYNPFRKVLGNQKDLERILRQFAE
ncbi:phosphate/phosphite/phosphonate ABC transporter substrate-binding protein [Terrimonas sp. NA20]|uniref:Phosphate/phosphite/phosphonate ABC transporter substrate-binding protein n=1 Tax=Terrimonas ginsenosidimutans TaxID=2908004 RepID=A0ABS9KL61_9BACT|nr:phosphate/phosphite/phosphonate ABC transporter substrate-binding protein [Terrimonas ginsenosidimutans]MCG2613055.1 phosphate/phosphite/phosphonate ABC transporter substrate-binding protein [Terrimonas ginsenosidimutans]